MSDTGHEPNREPSGPSADRRAAGVMPPWEVDALPDPPRFRLNPRRLIGPGLMMAGAAIGGGEWLTGPAMTAQYGGALMWIATLSILFQSAYNLEVMRYTLYCGEPIFVGFFRTLPGPRFWTGVYLVLDFGAIWPYLSASAAVPIVTVIVGHPPGVPPGAYVVERDDNGRPAQRAITELSAQFALDEAVVREMLEHPERFGPLADVQANTSGTPLPPETQREMAEQPERFTSVEGVLAATGLSADFVEQLFANPAAVLPDDATAWKPYPESVARQIEYETDLRRWLAYVVFLTAFIPLVFGGTIYNALEKLMVGKIVLVLGYLTFLGIFYVDWSVWTEIFSGFVRFGALPEVQGVPLTWGELFDAFFEGRPSALDLPLLASFAAIAGIGGLSNTNFSAYAREKGWGMGPRVGAIPSAIGGKGIKLSHIGKVFRITPQTLERWSRWRKIVFRDQTVWIVGCILGMGIPALISLQFVPGEQVTGDRLAAMTAEGIRRATGISAFWALTLLCGFLVLGPSQVSSMDGIFRRWTDVIWTGSRQVRHLEGEKVKYVYYSVLLAYMLWGLAALTLIPDPLLILKVSSVMMNFALGFSAVHTLVVNLLFLPEELRPGWFMRGALAACAVFFIGISAISVPGLLALLGN